MFNTIIAPDSLLKLFAAAINILYQPRFKGQEAARWIKHHVLQGQRGWRRLTSTSIYIYIHILMITLDL